MMKSAVLALFCVMAALPARSADFRTEPLEIRKQDGTVQHFTVEVATTTAERELGLMNRKQMSDDHGMIFDFGESRPVYMWMKDTYLPLDMLFLSDTGKITHIHPDAEPFSESIIDSHGLTHFVIELNGGLAARLGIREGDVAVSDQITKSAPAKK